MEVKSIVDDFMGITVTNLQLLYHSTDDHRISAWICSLVLPVTGVDRCPKHSSVTLVRHMLHRSRMMSPYHADSLQ
jgi:hypothetical protein